MLTSNAQVSEGIVAVAPAHSSLLGGAFLSFSAFPPEL